MECPQILRALFGTNKRHVYMKRFLYILPALLLLVSCGKKQHAYEGTFTTETGYTFQLRPDSTVLITLPDSSKYDSRWKILKTDSLEWVNIEFGADQEYYYLYDGVLYRSERAMRAKSMMGDKVTYQD